MKTFTRSDVMSWRPCYGEDATIRIMEGLPAEMTAIDVLRHESATPADRLWCVLRPEVLSDQTLRLFAAWCARTALDAERTAGREPDPRSWAAVDVAERHAVGHATEDEMCSAHDAAFDAGCDSAYAAAYAAAYATSLDDDCAAASAYAAARAAYAGARAACDAAYAYEAQIERLFELIEENEE